MTNDHSKFKLSKYQLLPVVSTLCLSMDSQEAANYINTKLLFPLFLSQREIYSEPEPTCSSTLNTVWPLMPD